MAEVKRRLVVLDPLVLLHSGDENKASEMGRVMRGLVALTAEHECCVLVVHHVNKRQAERKTTRAAQLNESRDTLHVKGRQVGATECAAGLAVHTAMTKAGSTSAIISPSLRQSSEVTVRARLGFWALGETLRQDSVSLLRLANGSRVISLPGSARGIRGYSCDLVVLDEAAWLGPDVFTAARPLTAAHEVGSSSSTPGAPVGPFYDLVVNPPDGWAFLKVRSDEVGTISAEFLERERREMAPELYAQEYKAEFSADGGAGSLFRLDQLAALVLEKA